MWLAVCSSAQSANVIQPRLQSLPVFPCFATRDQVGIWHASSNSASWKWVPGRYKGTWPAMHAQVLLASYSYGRQSSI